MRPPQVGDMVLFVPRCTGDMCEHEPLHDRAALVNDINPDGTLGLTVFHPTSVAMLSNVRHGGPGQLRTWYWREEVS